jgi:cytochrome c oxidase subunit 2
VLFKRTFKAVVASAVATSTLFLSGCSQEELGRAILMPFPASSSDVTNHTDKITDLWNISWAVLWGVGIIAWALMFWAIIVYRRRKGEVGLPAQMRYNNPIEALFTVVPLILVMGFFAFTARDMRVIEAPNNPEVTVEVIGKQWSWDFNYTQANVYDTGIQSQYNGGEGDNLKDLPTLYLPVNKRVEIVLNSRDVIHSFWVIDFLYKKDMLPGKTNHMYFTPTKEGNYMGKCAELCGEYHSMMLFNVKVVSQSEYEKHLLDLQAAGQVGQLSLDASRNQNLPGVSAPEEKEGE